MEKQVGWILIPPYILASKELSFSEKLLFGKILGLIGEEGYCFASNDYLAKNLGLSVSGVKKIISRLETKGFIRREVVRNSNNEVIERRLYPTPHTRPSTTSYPAVHHIINNSKLLSKDNNGGKPPKKEFGNGKVNLILKEFENRFKRKPVDARPRQVAWNMLRNIRRGYRDIFGREPTDDEFKDVLGKLFDWFMEKNFSGETYKLDTVRRYIKAVLEKVLSSYHLKKKQLSETIEIPEQTPEEREKALKTLEEMRKKLARKLGLKTDT